MEVAGGNGCVLAAGIAVAAMMQLSVLKRTRTLVQTGQGAYIVLALLKKMHTPYVPNQGAPGHGERLNYNTVVGLTWICLQLNCCCDSKSSYSNNRSFPSRSRFPVELKRCASIAVQVQYVTHNT